MPAFEWVHVQLHQQKGMISLSPPTICNSARTSTTQNKQLWQGWVNVLYNPYKPITLGIEYVYGERETFDNRNGIDNRFNMIASYDF